MLIMREVVCGSGVGGGIRLQEFFVLFAQFCHKPKTAIESKSYFFFLKIMQPYDPAIPLLRHVS